MMHHVFCCIQDIRSIDERLEHRLEEESEEYQDLDVCLRATYYSIIRPLSSSMQDLVRLSEYRPVVVRLLSGLLKSDDLTSCHLVCFPLNLLLCSYDMGSLGTADPMQGNWLPPKTLSVVLRFLDVVSGPTQCVGQEDVSQVRLQFNDVVSILMVWLTNYFSYFRFCFSKQNGARLVGLETREPSDLL